MKTATEPHLASAGNLVGHPFSRSVMRIWPPRNTRATPSVRPKGEIELPLEFPWRPVSRLLSTEKKQWSVIPWLRDPIKHTGTVVAANDAPMHGHVTRAEHRGDTFLLRLQFKADNIPTLMKLELVGQRHQLRGYSDWRW